MAASVKQRRAGEKVRHIGSGFGYAGCLAPHSKLRAAILPTPRQQGVDGEQPKTGIPYWN
jgi:hypothetical protein